jgi:hypothetical protein
MIDDLDASNAVIRVGDGRGFIVQANFQRLVITAAHCLPHFPPCHGASYREERSYENLLGPVDAAAPNVWAECVFADPIADIAVLGSPDHQSLSSEAEAYEMLTEDRPIYRIGAIPRLGAADRDSVSPARLLTLERRWIRCEVRGFRGLWIEGAAEEIRGGMSGSPILDEEMRAIGVVCVSGAFAGGPNPCLANDLPVWLARELLPQVRPFGSHESNEHDN